MISAGANPTLPQLIAQPLSSAGFAYALGERADIGAAHAELPTAHRLPPHILFGHDAQRHIAQRLIAREALRPPLIPGRELPSVFLELIVPLPMMAPDTPRETYLDTYGPRLLALQPALEPVHDWEVLLQSVHFDSGDLGAEGVVRRWPYAFVLIDRKYNGGLLRAPTAEDLAPLQALCESALGVKYQHPAIWDPYHRLGRSTAQGSALTAAQQQIQRLEAQLVSAMAGSRALRDESLHIRTSSQMLMQRHRSMRLEGRALQAKTVAMAAESTALRAQNSAMAAESTALRAQNDAMAAESTALRAQNTAMAEESSGLRAENAAIAAESEAIHAANAQLRQTSTTLQREVDEHERQHVRHAQQDAYELVRAFLKGSGLVQVQDLRVLQQWHVQQRAEIMEWAQRIWADEDLSARSVLQQLRNPSSLPA